MVRDSWLCDIIGCGCEDISNSFFIKPKLSITYDRNDPDNYPPVLELFRQDGQSAGITRKFLKVKVINEGRAIAHSCRAEMRVITGESRQRHYAGTASLY
jgi:hypothetical protein